jgi:DNA-binding Lrp family transcriptional regulator
MKREIITITDEGEIVVPANTNRVRMTITEIANLLGIYSPTAKRHIRAIEKSGIAEGDYKMACIVDGNGAYPEYYGLEMVVTVAFRVKSWQADRFRRWLLEQATRPEHKLHVLPPISFFVPIGVKTLPN